MGNYRFCSDQRGTAGTSRITNRLAGLFTDDLSNYNDLLQAYRRVLTQAIQDWAANKLSDQQARFLGFYVRTNLLPNQLANNPELKTQIEEYRRIENALPLPTSVPGIIEREGVDHPLWVRGNPQTPGDNVPRGFLEVFGDSHYDTTGSGRLELAKDLANPENPLVGRS